MPPAPLHITFATRDFRGPARELQAQARRAGFRTRLYTPAHPVVRQLARDFPAIMGAKRGAGYWLWKPAIILDALRREPDGGIVLYTDAATRFTADPRAFLDFVADRPSAFFEHPVDPAREDHLVARRWTKRDCFVLLDADRTEFWDRRQFWAGIQIHRAGPEARDLVAEWLRLATDERVLTDMPNVMGRPNLPEFVDHRHDQSVLTIVLQKRRISGWPDPTGGSPDGAPQLLEVHRRHYRYLESFALYRRGQSVYRAVREAIRPFRRYRALKAAILGRRRDPPDPGSGASG